MPEKTFERGCFLPIGEMSLVEGKPRMATCVAYGHPEDDPEREVGPIQLVICGFVSGVPPVTTVEWVVSSCLLHAQTGVPLM